MNKRNMGLLLLSAMIWGFAFVAQSKGNVMGPYLFNTSRCLLGGVVLLPVLAWRRHHSTKQGEQTEAAEGMSGQPEAAKEMSGQPEAAKEMSGQPEAAEEMSGQREPGKAGSPKTGKLRDTLLAGGLCGILLCIGSNLQQVGLQYTSAGKAGFITALYIVLVPIAGRFLGRRCSRFAWAGVAFAVFGLYLLCAGSLQGSMDGEMKGNLLVLLCAFAFTAHILVVDHFTAHVDGVKMSCLQFFVCGLISMVLMFLTETPSFDKLMLAPQEVLYAGILSCGVAYTLQIVGQRDVDPTLASLILCMESVFSVIGGAVFLQEKLGAREYAGCVLMFAAILLASIPDRKTEKA